MLSVDAECLVQYLRSIIRIWSDRVAQVEHSNVVEGLNPNPRTTRGTVGTIYHATSSRDFHLMPVNIGLTLFDVNDWQSFLGLMIMSNLVRVDVNDSFGRLPGISPTRSRTPSTMLDDGSTFK